MKVLIDDGLTLQKNLTGIGWYTKTLIESLMKLGVKVCFPKYSDLFLKIPTLVKRILYISYYSRKNVLREDIDIIHYTNFFVYPKKHRVPVVTTIHDLTVFRFPETVPLGYRQYGRLAIKSAINFSDVIAVPSYSVKDEIIEQFGDKDLFVEVIFQEVRENLFNDSCYEAKSLIEKPYFLFVGTIERRKNIFWFVETFVDFIEKTDNKELVLVLVGKKGYGFTKDFENFLDKSSNIIWFRYVDDKILKNLYNHALAFIYPSIYEGFGKPLIEAMFYRLPIIASNISTTIELNRRHGDKFYIYKTRKELFELMEFILKEGKKNVEYSGLEIYHPINVAKKHLELYKKLL